MVYFKLDVTRCTINKILDDPLPTTSLDGNLRLMILNAKSYSEYMVNLLGPTKVWNCSKGLYFSGCQTEPEDPLSPLQAAGSLPLSVLNWAKVALMPTLLPALLFECDSSAEPPNWFLRGALVPSPNICTECSFGAEQWLFARGNLEVDLLVGVELLVGVAGRRRGRLLVGRRGWRLVVVRTRRRFAGDAAGAAVLWQAVERDRVAVPYVLQQQTVVVSPIRRGSLGQRVVLQCEKMRPLLSNSGDCTWVPQIQNPSTPFKTILLK